MSSANEAFNFYKSLLEREREGRKLTIAWVVRWQDSALMRLKLFELCYGPEFVNAVDELTEELMDDPLRFPDVRSLDGLRCGHFGDRSWGLYFFADEAERVVEIISISRC